MNLKTGLSVVCLSLLSLTSTFALECSKDSKEDLRKKIAVQDSMTKSLNEQLKRRAELNKELNDFSSGAVMGAMRASIKVASLFASDESKEKIRHFFMDSLSVDMNKKLDTKSIDFRQLDIKQIKSDKDIDGSIDFVKLRYQENLESLTAMSNENLKRERIVLNAQINEIKSYKSNIPGMTTLEETSNIALEQEHGMALDKAHLIIMNHHTKELKLIQSICN